MKTLPLLAVLALGGLLLFYRLSEPPFAVFDEIMYPGAASHLLHHENLEYTHPPLGKLLIAAGIKLWGDTPFGDRFMGAMFGELLLIVVAFWTFSITGDWIASAGAAFFALANVFVFVLARTGTLEIFAVCFLFWAIAIFTSQWRSLVGIVLAGLSFGLCLSVKWMALAPLAACVGWLLVKGRARMIPILLAAALVPYLASYAVLAHLIRQKFTLSWFWLQQAFIWDIHVDQMGPYWNQSPWWSWPLKLKPEAMSIADQVHIVLLGNPVVMWLGLIAVVVLALRRQWLVSGVFAVLYLQYALMPLPSRYYYYYFGPAVCLSVALAVALRLASPRLQAAIYFLAGWVFLLAYPALAVISGGHWRAWL